MLNYLMTKNYLAGRVKITKQHLLFSIVASYILFKYGQNIFEEGTFIRKYFYFSGMSFNFFLISILLFKVFKNDISKFFIGVALADLINNLFFYGQYSCIEVLSILLATLIITLK